MRLLFLQVQIPPEWIRRPETVEGIEQHEVELACEASGTPVPHYTWVDWEGRDALDREGWTLRKETGYLTARGLRREDRGEYTCIAENPAGRLEAKALLDVVIKPKVQELYNQTMKVGQAEGRLICKASGEPEPEIIWRKWSRK